jgi:hypothetical protein
MAWRARSSDAGIRWVYVRNVKPGSWCPRYSANARMLVPCSSCICAIEAAWSVAARSLPCPAPVEAPRHATNLACRGDGASRTGTVEARTGNDESALGRSAPDAAPEQERPPRGCDGRLDPVFSEVSCELVRVEELLHDPVGAAVGEYTLGDAGSGVNGAIAAEVARLWSWKDTDAPTELGIRVVAEPDRPSWSQAATNHRPEGGPVAGGDVADPESEDDRVVGRRWFPFEEVGDRELDPVARRRPASLR